MTAAGNLHPVAVGRQAFGFAAPASAVVQSGHAAESWTVTADEVDAWLRTAQPGERLIYAHGPQLVQGAAAARVAELTSSGDVTPHNRRDPADGGFDFFICRCRPLKPARAPICDPPMMAVLLEIQQSAIHGERCPSDAEIGEATGLTADQVKWQLKKLEAGKFIARRTVRTRSDPRFRIVTVVATGASTAGPQA